MTPTTEPSATKTLVLLIDDQLIIAAALHKKLASFSDIELIATQDAETGFALALSKRPDVILQDLIMPGVDGMQQILRIRANPDLAVTPLVVLSSNADAVTKEKCFGAGANDYLVKFPDDLELVARIRYHASMGRAQRDRDNAMRSLAQSQSELVRRNAEVDAANRKLFAMNKLLGEESQEQRERIAEVAAFGIKLGRAQDLDEVLDQTLRLARAITNADAGSIWMIEKGVVRLKNRQNDTIEATLAKGERLPLADIVLPPDSTSIAGYVATTGRLLRIDDVQKLDASLPCQFRPEFEIQAGYNTQSMLIAPLRDGRDEVLVVLQLINARGRGKSMSDRSVFTAADEAALEFFIGMASLAVERARLVRGMIMRIIAAAEMRDPMETGAHVQRVAECSVAMYERWATLHNIDDSERHRRRDELRIAAMLHDVGKIGIPDLILKKPGKLDDAEYKYMQTHSVRGGRLFAHSTTPYDDAAREVITHHHEKWDSTGYPGFFDAAMLEAMPTEFQANPDAKPLRGLEIPLFARIVAVADVYDALTSKRVYKDAWTAEQVTEFLRKESGRAFDPELVDIALELEGYFRSVRARFASENA